MATQGGRTRDEVVVAAADVVEQRRKEAAVVAKDALLDRAENLLERRRLFGDRPRAVLVLVALAGDVGREVAKRKALVVARIGDELDVRAVCDGVGGASAHVCQ